MPSSESRVYCDHVALVVSSDDIDVEMRNIFVAFAVRLSRLARGHAPLQTFPSFLKHKLPVH